jgi:hypothetical protein
MSRCQQCNTELPDGARFCGICGSTQQPQGWPAAAKAPGAQEAIVTTQDIVTTIQDTPPISPVVSLNPTRSIYTGIKKASSPGEAGGDTLSPINPEKSQQMHGDKETLITSGELEISKDMIPETPKPSTDVRPFTALNVPEIPEPAASAETTGSPAPPLPVERAAQFKSRIRPDAPDSSAQPAASDESQKDQANRTAVQMPTPGQAGSLIRPVGISPSSTPPAYPRTPVPGGTSKPIQPESFKPDNMFASPRMAPPSSPPISELQQPLTPGYTVMHGNTQNPQQPIQSRQQQPGAANSTGSPWGRSFPEDHTLGQSPGLERLESTSRAAEHWRQSWRDRQRAEAGPAENVSRGQAAVPMPLMAMQQSLARMRAVIITNQKQGGNNRSTGFWIAILLMICLIAGLGVYIFSSYPSGSPFGGTQNIQPPGTVQPSLVIQGKQPVAFAGGQSIQLHGEHFGANDTITFLLDTALPIIDTSGRNISVPANGQGTFDATIPVGNDWMAGSHVIEALDTHTNQFAYLTIEVQPAGTPVVTSRNLALLLNRQPLQELSFNAVIGQENPGQLFTLSNISGAPLKWSAVAIADHNLTWLSIDDNHNSGTLNINGTDTIGISTDITGLKSSTKPYTGQIIFTINDHEQLTLPVQLMVNDAPSELVFSPQPVIAHFIIGGTCQTGQNGASLTLINLGEKVISWKLGLDANTKIHLHFSSVQGMLGPSDQSIPQLSPTQVLTLTCTGVQIGSSYTISLYANGAQWTEQIFIQQ